VLREGYERKKGGNIPKHITEEYKGSKWGGKYLRAPDIFFTILEKGKGKLVRLGDIAEVRFGIKTGANEFFYVEDVTERIDFNKVRPKIKNLGEINYLNEVSKNKLRVVCNRKHDSYWLIEEEFLAPVIKSPRECKSILIRVEDLKYKIFICNKSRKELERTKALEYILWGERQGYHRRPTCASRKIWWD
jgi:hypothetical protein